ncbi:MAG: FeoA family protein [Bacteroidota bacterium]
MTHSFIDTECLLSECTTSGTYRVSHVKGEFTDRLQELGILPGVELSFIRTAPLGFPIEIKVRGQLLALRKAESECVVLESAE